jgi:hypothetical protein
LFSIGRPAHFEPDGFAQQPLERGQVAIRRPDLQFGVARGAELQEEVFAAIAQLEARDHLRVTAVEALRDAHDGRQQPHGPAEIGGKVRIFLL